MPKKYNSDEERMNAFLSNRRKAQLKYYYKNKTDMNKKRVERAKRKRDAPVESPNITTD